MMKRYLWIVFGLLPLAVGAQKSENHKSAISRNLEIFSDIYRALDLFYVDSLSADTVLQWGVDAMLQRVDPYTEYYPQDDDELMEMAQGKYAGIGAAIRFNKEEDRAMVTESYENTPSMRAGLRPGDIILTIDDKDVKGLPLNRVTHMLRGEAGTTFQVTVKRWGEKKPLKIKITRETITMPHIPYYGMVAPGVGFISLTGFSEGDALQMRAALTDLKGQGAQKLVLDLRGNPGGAMEEALDIANLFLSKGRKVLYTRGKMAGMNRELYTRMEPVDTLMPLAILVDGMSASAAEILSGSMQDFDRAVVLGTRTYGKGLVQSIRDLPYGGNIKITTARYYIPSGRCVQAYDYRHLNEDGSARTLPDSLTHLFHTQSGREVRDGGGIMPDVEVRPDSLPTLIYDLVQSDAFFDFCTQYTAQHPTFGEPGQVSVSDEDFQALVDYMVERKFTYNRRTDEVLKVLKDVAQREGYLELAQEEFDRLQAKLTGDVRSDMNRFRGQIEPYLLDELVTRYYHRRGAERQRLVGDKCLEKALEILGDENAYRRILSPKER